MSALIIVRITALMLITGLLGPVATSSLQDTNPDKFINFIKKDPSAVAFTLPGWFIKMGGNLASRSEMDDDEAEIIKELTGHIKKLRFVVSEELPEGFEEQFANLQEHLKSNDYEPLIEVRDEGSKVYLWAKFEGQVIKRMVISVLSDDDTSVFFNIKSDLDFERLKKMEFYQDWNEKNA